MTTAAELIAALNGKRTRQVRLSLRPEVPGQLPPGWQRWFDGMQRVDAASAGSKPQSWVGVLLQRPLRPVPRSPALLTRWQAMASLLRQEWEPDSGEDRGLRIGVGALDILLHLALVALLVWLVYLGFLAAAPASEEEQVVQIEFIGRGNIAEGGGAIANAGAESAPAAAAPATRASTQAPAPGRPDAPTETLATPSPPEASASTQAAPLERESAPTAPTEAAQVLQVTEVATPEPRAFQLPPPRPLATPQPQLQIREIQPRQQVEEIATLKPPTQRILQPQEARAEVQVPRLREAPRALEVPAPQRLPMLQERPIPSQATGTAQIQVPQLRGEVREIPMPPGGAPAPSPQAGNGAAAQAATNSPGAGGERGTSPASGQELAGAGQGARPAEQGGRGVATSGSGAGPARQPATGGWPGPAKSDDWGASRRNVDGTGNGNEGNGTPGLFNKDGSTRLPDEWTQQTGIDVDRAGTWLKRPGLEYRGTRFDRYWIPQGTLLEEWVRRGVKKVSIPIPGSKVRLECVVSLLQLGGGCYPVNPDVNEQPARARPPPDIPFKPELQEDNGSVQP